MILHRASCHVSERSPQENGEYTATIAVNDATPFDREIVSLADLDMSAYMRNPVIFWAHDRWNLPVATTTGIERGPDGSIRARFKFLEGDEMAERVRNAWDQGALRAASISWSTATDPPRLMEWSIVSIPADPDALRDGNQYLDRSLARLTKEIAPCNVPQEGNISMGLEEDAGDVSSKQIENIVDVVASKVGDRVVEHLRALIDGDQEAQEPADEDTAVMAKARERAAILVAAGDLLENSPELDGLTDRELMERALGDTAGPLAEKSDDYVHAVFDMTVASRATARTPSVTKVPGGGGAAKGMSVLDIRRIAEGANRG